MRNDQMLRRKIWTQLLGCLQQGVIIRDEYLDAIANVSQFSWRADKIWYGTWRSVPNVNLKSSSAQMPGYAATDDPESNYPDFFARSMRHSLLALFRRPLLIKMPGKQRPGNAEIAADSRNSYSFGEESNRSLMLPFLPQRRTSGCSKPGQF
jgi:hypothetical protein